ncbi:hypothetical protein [Bacillus coreaensis]
MGGFGFDMMSVGLLGWALNLATIGIIVYFAVKLALKSDKAN